MWPSNALLEPVAISRSHKPVSPVTQASHTLTVPLPKNVSFAHMSTHYMSPPTDLHTIVDPDPIAPTGDRTESGPFRRAPCAGAAASSQVLSLASQLAARSLRTDAFAAGAVFFASKEAVGGRTWQRTLRLADWVAERQVELEA